MNNRSQRMISWSLCATFFLWIFLPLTYLHAETRSMTSVPVKGVGPVILTDSTGAQIGLYKESHALLIGVSNYTAGWPDLESIPGELDKVQAVLEKHGFHVVRVIDPDSEELPRRFKQFINKYGYQPDNRLLFYFSGHGYTRLEGKKGYLVPTDAPDPRIDEIAFAQKSLAMGQILAWAKDIEAKHALFLFDSCFSGTIFKTRALPKIPKHISAKTSRPVRQFITAGSAGEEVPAESVFTPMFIRALEGEGDINSDGYVTGEELGMFLHDKVVDYSQQTPQYGKIRDPNLDMGDFVFPLKTARLNKPKPPTGLSDEPPAPVMLLGSLQVNVNIKARVKVNGKDRGSAEPDSPLNLKGLNTGTVTVRVEAEGYAPMEKSVTIQRGQWTQEVFEFKHEQVASLDPSVKPEENNRGAPKGMVKIGGGQATRSLGGGKKVPVFLKPFYMDRNEVTYSEYENMMGEPPPGSYAGGQSPVISITYNQAREYCNRVGKRLPIEAEWQMAGSAGYRWLYPWGHSVNSYGSGYGVQRGYPSAEYPGDGYGIYGKQGAWSYGPTDDFSVYRDSHSTENVLSQYGLRCAQ